MLKVISWYKIILNLLMEWLMESINEIDFMNEMTFKPQKRQAKSIPIPFFENEWIGLICLLSSLAAWMELIGGALLFLNGWVSGAAGPRQPAKREDKRPDNSRMDSSLFCFSWRNEKKSKRREERGQSEVDLLGVMGGSSRTATSQQKRRACPSTLFYLY